MTLNVEMVTFDCSDPAKLGGWWAQQFGGTSQELLAGEFTAVTLAEGPKPLPGPSPNPGPPSKEAGPPTPADGTALASTLCVQAKPTRMTREHTFRPPRRLN
jgi:hypothetical protein